MASTVELKTGDVSFEKKENPEKISHRMAAYLAFAPVHSVLRQSPEPSAPPEDAAVSAIPTAPPPDAIEAAPRVIERSNWSSYRIKRLALYVLGAGFLTAGVSSLVGVAATVMPPLGIAFGIGLSIFGAGFLGWGASIVDYHNSHELAALRQSVSHQPLSKIVQEHSWRRIFKYAILLPDQVYEKFCATARDSGIMDIINMYEAASQAYEKVCDRKENEYAYTLPHPTSWRWKFEESLCGINAQTFFSQFNLQLLKKYGFISFGAYRDLSELQTVYTSEIMAYTEKVNFIRQQYESLISRVISEMNREIDHAQREYENHPSVVRLKNLNTEYEERIASALRGINERIEVAADRYNSYKEGLLHGRDEEALTNEEIDALEARYADYEIIVGAAEQEATDIRRNLRAEKRTVSVSLEREVTLLNEQRRDRIERIRLHSALQVKDLKAARDREIEYISVPFLGRLETINTRFYAILKAHALIA